VVFLVFAGLTITVTANEEVVVKIGDLSGYVDAECVELLPLLSWMGTRCKMRCTIGSQASPNAMDEGETKMTL
jgi:hypothetical protein